MSLVLQKIKAETKPLIVKIEREKLALTYRPNVITFAWARSLEAVGDAEKPDEAIVSKVLEAVESWELEYTPGELVPLTAEALLDIPTHILTAIIMAVAGYAPAAGKTAPASKAIN